MSITKIKKKIIFYIFILPQILKYKFLSTANIIIGKPTINQAVQCNGLGTIHFKNNVTLGIEISPLFYSSYIYIEARNPQSKVTIGENTFINNNCIIIAEGEGIDIASNCLIGINCEITDSDFHNLKTDMCLSTTGIQTKKVILEENVFVGSNVKILKGVTIGKNSVIANSSVVTKSIPPNVIAGGVPAKILKNL